MILYHAAPTVRALAIMLRGFHDRRDADVNPFGYGISFLVDAERPEGASGVVLSIDDAEALRPFAATLWRTRGSSVIGSYGYLLPADVANCYLARMVGEVGAADPLRD
jgi:hypothetical protein